MVAPAIVYSVPGTGTRFCRNFLENVLGYTHVTPNRMDETNVFNQLHSGSINLDKIMAKYSDIKLVTPIRDPYLAFVSRISLDRPVNDIGLQNNKASCVEYWENLIEMTRLYDTVFLPIDCAKNKRLHHLVNVGKFLGANTTRQFKVYADQWVPIGSQGTTPAKDEYLKQGTIQGVKPIFLDFAIKWINTIT